MLEHRWEGFNLLWAKKQAIVLVPASRTEHNGAFGQLGLGQSAGGAVSNTRKNLEARSLSMFCPKLLTLPSGLV
jgi:hypothetical protein